MGAYEALFRKLLFPLYESGIRRRKTLQWLREYEANQWLSTEQIAELQWHKLKRLLEHCHREVPYYQRRWREIGMHPQDIRSLADYAQLPVLTKSDIRENFADMQASSLRDQLLFKNTGGSTGEPLRLGYTRESNERRVAVMWRGYAWAGARMGRRSLYLWGGAVGHPSRAQLWKDQLFHAAFARRISNTFGMTEANMGAFADAIDRYRPEVIVAYVGPLVRLAEWLLASGRRVHQPQAILGAAEALHEFQREIVQQAFGASMFNTYGCREFMLIASECEQRDGLHVNADHLVVEQVDPQPIADGGSAGPLAITDLHNYGMPFIRYLNGDMASFARGGCACGRGLPRLASVQGRVLDAIRTPDGRLIPGEFFPHMLKDVAGLHQFQVVQRELASLEMKMVCADDFDSSGLDYIRSEAAKVLGHNVELRFEFVDHIEQPASGKLRVTRSELT